jgi:hypothetical protein
MWLEKDWFEDAGKAMIRTLVARLEGQSVNFAAPSGSQPSSGSSSREKHHKSNREHRHHSKHDKEHRGHHHRSHGGADSKVNEYANGGDFGGPAVGLDDHVEADALGYDYGDDEDDEERIEKQKKRLDEQGDEDIPSDLVASEFDPQPSNSGIPYSSSPPGFVIVYDQTNLATGDTRLASTTFSINVDPSLSDFDIQRMLEGHIRLEGFQRIDASRAELSFGSRAFAEESQLRLVRSFGNGVWRQPALIRSPEHFDAETGECIVRDTVLLSLGLSVPKEDVRFPQRFPVAAPFDPNRGNTGPIRPPPDQFGPPHSGQRRPRFEGQGFREEPYADDFRTKRPRGY